MTRSRIESLQRTAMFGAINEATIAFLLERAKTVAIAAGDFFFREGDPGHSAYLIEAGELSVIKIWEDEEHLLRHLRPGDCFGEVALLDLGPRSASVRADTEARAIEISSIDLLAVSRVDAEQFALIYMNLGRELSRRLRQADERSFRTRLQSDSPALNEGWAAIAASRESDEGEVH